MHAVDRAVRETVEPVEGVHLTQLAAGERMSVQQFHIEPGARIPIHDHPHEQIGYVHDGALTLLDADETTLTITTGESYAIPGGERHAAENRGDVPVAGVDVFSPPREGPPRPDENE